MLVVMAATTWAAWEDATALTVSMTSPANDTRVWLAGSDHAVTCTPSDTDKCRKQDGTTDASVADDLTIWWAGPGTWKDNKLLGASVTYICTDTAGANALTVFADDNKSADAPADASGNSSLFEEAKVSDSHTVSVIVPALNTVTYGAGSSTISDVPVPQYDRAASRNGAATFVRNTSPSCVAYSTFWHGTSLTDASSVSVYGVTSGDDMSLWAVTTGSFGTTWPSSNLTHSGGPLNDHVKKITYSTAWKYKVATGSDTWIDTTTQSGCVAYLTFATPVQVETKDVFEYSCRYCDGRNTTKTDVCWDVLNGMANEYTYAGGNCAALASNFGRLVGVQGVASSQEQWYAGGGAVGSIKQMRTKEIPTINAGTPNPKARYAWTFHRWVTAEGANWDPSSQTQLMGNWGAYEDVLFKSGGTDDYDRVGQQSIANPPGQGGWPQSTLTHSNPDAWDFTTPR